MEPRRRFRFIREIAQGGFGKVYLAEMITGESFSSIVAIKLLHGRWLDNDEIVMRSRDEARLLGRIRHRNIVRVEDLTSINSQCAIIMEYLEGVDLKSASTWLREHNLTFPFHSVFEIISSIAAALDAAYNQSPLQGGQPLHVIHRDIKPSNCMITAEGEVKVLDFGTARATFEDREAKTQALAFGSQAYMAPERMLAEPDSPSGDVFSLGVTLYEILALKSFGKIYLRPDKFENTLQARMEERGVDGRAVVNLTGMEPGLQTEVMGLLRSMLAYEPTARPSAGEIQDRMEYFAEQCRDLGIKRFARERVREIMAATVTEPDLDDKLPGTTVVEDTSSFSQANAIKAVEEELFKAPPELVEPPSEEEPVDKKPRAAITSEFSVDPTRTASKRTQDKVTAPQVPPDLIGRTEAPVTRIPSVSEKSPADKKPAVKAPTDSRTPEPHPESSGGTGRIAILIGVLLFLGILVLGGGWMVLSKMGENTDVPTPTPTPTAANPPSARLPPGESAQKFEPSAAGKGSVVLVMSEPANEVEISSVTGFRSQWDGTLNLNLRNLDPGPMRTKVQLKPGGAAIRAEFRVELGKTCLYTFRSATTEWEKSECR
jgi:serine/threonine protein kinase